MIKTNIKTIPQKYQFEVAISVEDYWDAENMEDQQEAFEACQSDTDTAIELAQEELTEAGIAKALALNQMGGMKIKVVHFIEFDSNNLSHAGGYFLVEISGNKKDIDLVEKLHTDWMNR